MAGVRKLRTTNCLRWLGAIPAATALPVGGFIWRGEQLPFRPDEKRATFITIRLKGPEVGAPAERGLADGAFDGDDHGI